MIVDFYMDINGFDLELVVECQLHGGNSGRRATLYDIGEPAEDPEVEILSIKLNGDPLPAWMNPGLMKHLETDARFLEAAIEASCAVAPDPEDVDHDGAPGGWDHDSGRSA